MTKTVTKIKEVVKLNKPMFNEKFKVWVVRMKTNSGWKAVWRKQKEESQKVFDHLSKKVVKTIEPIEKKKEVSINDEPSNSLNDWNEKMQKEETKQKSGIASSVLKKVFSSSSNEKKEDVSK